jgi:tripeptide aminopeptidase
MTVDFDEALKDLLDLLSVEGVTGSEKNIANLVIKKLVSIGIPKKYILFDKANKLIPLPTQTGNLIVKLPGTKVEKRKLFSTHLDTVSLCAGASPKIVANKIIAKGNTALGADNRGGVACLITMLKHIYKKKIDHGPITILFTVREESGLWGARTVDVNDLGKPAFGFNCDGSSPYELITAAVGAERWQVEILGKGSHAGVSPEEGISSTMVAAIALSDIHKNGWFGKIAKNGNHGTSNIGYYGDKEGNCAGSSTNQVTDYVKINGESRSADRKFVSKISNEYKESFIRASAKVLDVNKHQSKIIFKNHIDYYPFNLNRNSNVVKFASKISKKIGFAGQSVSCNGGLDANWLIKKKIPTITFGNGHYKPHSIGEYLNISEFKDSCLYAIALATN